MAKFKNKELKELLKIHNQQYMKLVKWLLKTYPKIWRQYEKEMCGKLKLEIIGVKDVRKNKLQIKQCKNR